MLFKKERVGATQPKRQLLALEGALLLKLRSPC
jgi:hypothetical protein